jgi:hypothetical protein
VFIDSSSSRRSVLRRRSLVASAEVVAGRYTLRRTSGHETSRTSVTIEQRLLRRPA